VGACLLERRFRLPARDESAKDAPRLGREVGAEECLRLACAGRIAHQPLRSHSPRCARGTFGCSAQRIGAGGSPEQYQTAVSEATSNSRDRPPYHSATVTRDQTVSGSSTALNPGSRFPFSRGRPICPGRRGGAGANRLASIRSRVTSVPSQKILGICSKL